MNVYLIIFYSLTILVGLGSIIANIWIAKENAGKNRVIYTIEEMPINSNPKSQEELNKKLSSGNYTVLTVSTPSSTVAMMRIYSLGKIKP